MRREYIDSMKANGFGEFFTACEDLKNSKYIIAGGKITALLKSIADNKQLYSMFGSALYGFDYKAAFAQCLAGGGFSLPADPKTAVALVFRILLDIDNGKMPLNDFLGAYFYSESINESFARFGLEVLAPFESYCRTLFASSAEQEIATDDGTLGEAYDSAGDKYFTGLKSDAITCIDALAAIADGYLSDPVDRGEYKACLSGLARAVRADNGDDMISAFVGVKYAVAYFFKARADVLDIYKKLEYNIKHLVSR